MTPLAQGAPASTSSLVSVIGGQAVTTSLAIAEGTNTEHASVIKLVRTYLSDLEEFGLVRFEIRPREVGKHGGGDVEYAILNEQQGTLVLAFMRNTDIVVGFKKRLVKAFWEMARQLSEKTAPQVSDLSTDEVIDLLISKAGQEKRDLQERLATLEHVLAVVEPMKKDGGVQFLRPTAIQERHPHETAAPRPSPQPPRQRQEPSSHGQSHERWWLAVLARGSVLSNETSWPTGPLSKQVVYFDYARWCEAQGISFLTYETLFARAMKAWGCVTSRPRGQGPRPHCWRFQPLAIHRAILGITQEARP
ncbi:hypothetical protein CCP3SC15_1280004 [Gammaproteobacteria bacterium]